MSKALELENKLQMLTDEVKDLFHATQINLEALNVEATHKSSSKQLISIIKQCQDNIKYLKSLLEERSNLRLNYLITEQIKQEEAKVRRERLTDYEDKILDQRRLISDKQTFYDNLLRPKKKRPQNMALEEFQEIRRKEISDEENRKYKWLKQQIDRLSNLYSLLRQEHNRINEKVKEEQVVQQREEEMKEITQEIEKNQVLYEIVASGKAFPQTFTTEEIQMLESIKALKNENNKMLKEYIEEKQMHQYLKWENKKLADQYKHHENQLKELRNKPKFKPTNLFERPVSR